MNEDIIAEVDPSGPRRWIGIGMMLSLGGLLLYIAFAQPPAAIGWQLFLIALGLFALWFAHRLQEATTRKLYLTETVLKDSDGRVLVQVDEIEKVDRGMLAVKPSKGFMLKLKNPAPRAWQPGLWWRLGRRVAVGGVTPGGQTRPMADIIAVMISKREG
ncbi:hypothetical protein [Marivita hallyeonensis]|uniref:Uncharacterized protein n=1 Tax=Marivita hallyeonensis TaxID=996342 RepID=A0A1M5MST7_9RHOB|nr:hypothetical protein [Marivita hallyeonensis]SHG79853.1 hypothetical protein SAMN05443551_0622 [Marivita hallyeonensis]